MARSDLDGPKVVSLRNIIGPQYVPSAAKHVSSDPPNLDSGVDFEKFKKCPKRSKNVVFEHKCDFLSPNEFSRTIYDCVLYEGHIGTNMFDLEHNPMVETFVMGPCRMCPWFSPSKPLWVPI